MKQTFKMKQTFNKFSLGILLVIGFGLILVPEHKADSTYAIVEQMNGGGGGGGGTTTTTTTTGAVVYTGAITLNASLDKNVPYTGSQNVVISASASVSACSNTDLNLRVSGNVTGPSTVSVGNILNAATVGSTTIADTASFKAPSKSGSYTLNLTADRYDPSGYVLMDSYNTPISYQTDATFTSNGSTYLVSTNYRGRITKVKQNGYDLGDYVVAYASDLKDYDGSTVIAKLISEDIIKTYTSTINFEVAPTTVTVGKTSVTAIPSGSTDTITWESAYATHCNTCKMNDPVNGPNCPNFTPGLTGSFKTTQLTSTTTYYIKCDNY